MKVMEIHSPFDEVDGAESFSDKNEVINICPSLDQAVGLQSDKDEKIYNR